MGSDGGSQKSNTLAPFLVKTYDMVDDPSTDHIISWSSTGSSFVVWNSTDFCRDLLPQYFKHNNLSSFVRQLNTYGFRKICPDQWEFATEGFLKGQRDALKSIRRRKPLSSSNSSGQVHDDGEHQQLQPESPQCTILAHQELEGEVNRLQQDKKLLLDQLTKLQSEHQSTETNLLDLGKRLQSLEERQQQILSFLARVANPAFWAQFVQHPSKSNMLLVFNKKRRLLDNEEVLAGSGDHQEVLVGMGESGDTKADTTTAEKDALGTWWTNSKTMPSDVPCEGILRQLSPRFPQSQSLGSSPISLGSGVFLREVHTPAECVDNEEALVGTGEHQQGAVETGDSTHDDGNIVGKTTADKHASGTLKSNSKSVFSADVPGEGILRQLSLCPPPSNQSLVTSPISLSSGVTLREVHTPDTPMNNVSDSVACARQSSETMDYSIWTPKSGDDRVALSLHLRERLRCLSSSAPKFSEKKISKKTADGLGSNDGFWEKYLTESPSSTDSEADSETESIENVGSPRERQFL